MKKLLTLSLFFILCLNAFSQSYYEQRALDFIEQNKYSAAFESVLNAIEQEDCTATEYSILYKIFDQSPETFDKILKFEYPEIAYFMFAVVYRARYQFDKALTLLKKTNFDNTPLQVAYVLEKLYKYEEALQEIEKGLEKFPYSFNYLCQKASYLGKIGQTERSINMIDSLIKVTTSEHYNELIEIRAWTYEFSQQLDKAQEDFQYLAESNQSVYDYTNLGRVCYFQNKKNLSKLNFDKVLAKIDQEIEEAKTTVYKDSWAKKAVLNDLYYLKADALVYNGKSSEAQEYIKKISHISFFDSYNLACIYSLMGDKEKALSYLETSIKEGYRDFRHIENDYELTTLRTNKTYKKMLEKYK